MAHLGSKLGRPLTHANLSLAAHPRICQETENLVMPNCILAKAKLGSKQCLCTIMVISADRAVSRLVCFCLQLATGAGAAQVLSTQSVTKLANEKTTGVLHNVLRHANEHLPSLGKLLYPFFLQT